MTLQRKPSVLIPYTKTNHNTHTQDIFVFMRPETNGVVGEKAIMNTIRHCPEYSKKEIRLVYLANIPSDTLIVNNTYTQYQALKIEFAKSGGAIFTPDMCYAFEEYFHEKFDETRIIGAFPALNILAKSPEQLFSLRVKEENMLTLNGQTIKKHKGYFIVNYDIPALVHRYSLQYDIAVMCFQTEKSYDYFKLLTKKMRAELIVSGTIAHNSLIGSEFHYSHGPFEQLHDGAYFLLNEQGEQTNLNRLSFTHYLLERNVSMDTVRYLMINPIVTLKDKKRREIETSIFDYTRGKSYREAYEILDHITAHSSIDPLGLITELNTSPTAPKSAKISATT